MMGRIFLFRLQDVLLCVPYKSDPAAFSGIFDRNYFIVMFF
jgi:hypothetical protein